LIIMGTRGRGQLAGLLLGSQSQKVITHAACPVMLIR
jgi:nucleotide-binding universal stress UspA family protein